MLQLMHVLPHHSMSVTVKVDGEITTSGSLLLQPELQEVLLEYHNLFSVGDEEQGETDLIQLSIDIWEASPIKQQARHMQYAAKCMQYAVRQEVVQL